MDGFIILDKPSGMFSKTAAARATKIFGTKKNGHIGTLDPMASGVLPVVMVADIVPDKSAVRATLHKFIGHIKQIPPVYSAVHISGVRAYELARAGKKPEIPARDVDIYELELVSVDGADWNFRMRCAPGTYVRSVARDIARACGTVATVTMIRRTRTSGWTIKNAVTLDFLENLFNNGGDTGKYLMPVDSGLGDIPVLNLNDETCRLYKNGGFIDMTVANGTYRVYSGGKFVGIGTVESNVLRPKRTI